MANIIVPPEWAPHKAIWTAWPSRADLWAGDLLARARAQVADMARLLADGDAVKILACGQEAIETAQEAAASFAEIIPAAFGDIWLRDTGPVFAKTEGKKAALRFRTNGWGGKFIYENDDTVGDLIAERAGTPVIRNDFVLEGGSVEFDGEGTLLTTRQCLLNENRNPGWTQDDAEAALRRAFGVTKIIWLDEGLAGDHTDGHIDNIARFAAPGVAVCMAPSGSDDPNAAVLDAIAARLSGETDAKGRRLDVVRIPSPGRVLDGDGNPVPASHMNYIIGNKTVAVPTYGTASAEAAVAALQKLFPGRRVAGLPADAILTGGGAFHCITQQEPA